LFTDVEVGAVRTSSVPVPSDALPGFSSATLPPPVPTRTKLVPLGGDGRNEIDVPVVHVPVVVPKSYDHVAAREAWAPPTMIQKTRRNSRMLTELR